MNNIVDVVLFLLMRVLAGAIIISVMFVAFAIISITVSTFDYYAGPVGWGVLGFVGISFLLGACLLADSDRGLY